MAPDESIGLQALHPSPGGERWPLVAYTRTNTAKQDGGNIRMQIHSRIEIAVMLYHIGDEMRTPR